MAVFVLDIHLFDMLVEAATGLSCKVVGIQEVTGEAEMMLECRGVRRVVRARYGTFDAFDMQSVAQQFPYRHPMPGPMPMIPGPFGSLQIGGHVMPLDPVDGGYVQIPASTPAAWICPAPGCKAKLHGNEKSCWRCGTRRP